MRKKLFAVLLMLCMLPLQGCHGSKKTSGFAVPETFDAEKNYEISFWAKNDTNKVQTAIYEKAIEDFEGLYPNIKVNLKLYTDYSRIYNDVITNIATATTPNVCITYPDHIATYLEGDNVVVPLDELLIDEKYGLSGSEVRFDAPEKEEIIPQFLSEGVLGEGHYALPFMRSSEACYINVTLLERMGYTLPEKLTWDFIWDVSEKAMEKNTDGTYKVNGQNVLIPFIYKSTDNMMIQWLKQNDAGYSTDEGSIEIFNDTTKQLLEKVKTHAGSYAFSTFKISSYPGNFLNANQCIFAIDSTAGATWIGADAPLSDISKEDIARFETEVMMIPQVNWENPKMISQGPSICLFNKDDPNEVLASWLFAQYLLTNEVQIAYSETEGYVPVTKKAQESEEYQDYLARMGEDNDTYYDVKIKAAKILLDNVEHTFVTPVFNGSASLRNAAGQMIENVAKSVRRKETIDDKYYEKLFEDMVSLFRLNETGAMNTGEKDLGPLPYESVVLIGVLFGVWIGIICYVIREYFRNKKRIMS
ncbi:MAG: extracellular solute-binding protein [Clostridia bacterium]|nr:extracellular solute-binding protein [Clostridia bacterium]